MRLPAHLMELATDTEIMLDVGGIRVQEEEEEEYGEQQQQQAMETDEGMVVEEDTTDADETEKVPRETQQDDEVRKSVETDEQSNNNDNTQEQQQSPPVSEELQQEEPPRVEEEVASSSSTDGSGTVSEVSEEDAIVHATESAESDDTATASSTTDATSTSPTVDEVATEKNDPAAANAASNINNNNDDDGPVERVVVDYASKSAGALILEKSPSMKGTSHLLTSDKDKYAIAPCQDKKFVVIGLSEDILVKQVKLANYERYSSHVFEFQIFGSQTMGQWVDLGKYKAAKNTNGEQTFDLHEPSWARYLKFRFLSHYGSEHYCTISQIKVHGSTQLQGFHEQWNEETGDGDEEVVDSTTTEEEEKQMDGTNAEQQAAASDSTKETTHGEGVSSSSSSSAEQEASLESAESDSTETDTQEDGSQQSADGDEATKAIPGAKILNGIKEKLAELLPSGASNETNNDGGDDEKELEGAVGGDGDDNEEAETEKRMMDVQPTDVLESASIPTSSEKAANSETPKVELSSSSSSNTASTGSLGSAADAVKAALADASDAILPSMNLAVEELQKKLATMISLDETAASILPNELMIDTLAPKMGVVGSGGDDENLTPNDPTDFIIGDGIAETPDVAENKREEGRTESSSSTKEETAAGVAEESRQTADEQKTSSSSQTQSSPTNTATPSSSSSSASASDDTATDDNYEIPQELVSVLARFPSASCLGSLDFSDFKKRMVAARSAATGANSQASNKATQAGNKMEPIFKTLTEEIKSLKLSQSVQDQFSKVMISCYQSILMDMAQELNFVSTAQAERLIRLEEEMLLMQSQSVVGMLHRLWDVVQWLVSLGVIFVHNEGLRLQRFIQTLVEHRTVVNLVKRLKEAEHESLILAAVTAVSTLMTWLVVMQIVRWLFSSPSSPSRSTSNSKGAKKKKQMMTKSSSSKEVPNTARPQKDEEGTTEVIIPQAQVVDAAPDDDDEPSLINDKELSVQVSEVNEDVTTEELPMPVATPSLVGSSITIQTRSKQTSVNTNKSRRHLVASE